MAKYLLDVTCWSGTEWSHTDFLRIVEAENEEKARALYIDRVDGVDTYSVNSVDEVVLDEVQGEWTENNGVSTRISEGVATSKDTGRKYSYTKEETKYPGYEGTYYDIRREW
jgi:hypothetical protein